MHISARHGRHALDPTSRAIQRRLPVRRQCALGKERRHAAPAALRCATGCARSRRTHGTMHDMTIDIHQILKQPAAPLSVPAGRPRARARDGQAHRGAEERDDQRAVLRRPLPAPAGDAGRADARGAGAGRGDAVVRRPSTSEPDDKTVFYFAGIDGARFKRPVEPGDQLILRRHARPHQGRHLQVHGRARVVGDAVVPRPS